MVSRFRDAHLEEVWITEHCIGRGEPAARVAIDPGAVNVDPRIVLSELLHARDLIRQSVVAHLAVIRIVE